MGTDMSDETLISLLNEIARENPDLTALIDGATNESITYSEFADRVEALAGGLLREGVRPSDTVVVFMDRSVNLVIAVFAIARVGATALVFIGPDHRPGTVILARDRLKSKPTLFIVDATNYAYQNLMQPGERWRDFAQLHDDREAAKSVPFPRATDALYYNLSSGSTSDAKMVIATHRHVIANARACAVIQGYTNDDVHLCSFNQHVHDLFTRALVTRAASVLLPSAQENPLQLASAILSTGVSCMMSSPMTLSLLEPFGAELRGSNLRRIECGGGALDEAVRRSLEKKIGVQVSPVFGSTETAGVAIAPPPGRRRPHHSIGVALQGYEVVIMRSDGTVEEGDEEGQLVIGGEAVAEGYVGDELVPGAHNGLKNGRFETGDLARRHRDGWISLRGRIANTFKICGVAINADRIERTIRETGVVRDAVVVPAPMYLLGSVPVALIVVDRDVTDIDALRRAIKGKLEDPIFEMPWGFIPIAEVPHTPAGKVDRVAARALVVKRGRRRRLNWGNAWFPPVLLFRAIQRKPDVLLLIIKHPVAMYRVLQRAFRRIGLW